MPKHIPMAVAGSVLANYRAVYKAKYNEDFNGTDVELLKIINNEPTWFSGDEQDEYTL